MPLFLKDSSLSTRSPFAFCFYQGVSGSGMGQGLQHLYDYLWDMCGWSFVIGCKSNCKVVTGIKNFLIVYRSPLNLKRLNWHLNFRNVVNLRPTEMYQFSNIVSYQDTVLLPAELYPLGYIWAGVGTFNLVFLSSPGFSLSPSHVHYPAPGFSHLYPDYSLFQPCL